MKHSTISVIVAEQDVETWGCKRFAVLFSPQSQQQTMGFIQRNNTQVRFSTLQIMEAFTSKIRIRRWFYTVIVICQSTHVVTIDFTIKPPRKSRPGSGYPDDPGLQQYRRRTGQGSRWNLGRRCYKPIVSRCLAAWAEVQRTGNDRGRIQGESPRGSGRSGSRGQRVRRRLQARLLL